MAQGSSLPAAPPRTPGLPQSPLFYDFQGWNGIDTKPPRPGIDDDKCLWCDNIMPLGPHNARAIPDRGATVYTASGILTITDYQFYGLASPIVNNGPHAIIFLSDGSAIDLALFPSTTATLAPAGTFSPPAGTLPGVRQYGTQFLLISTQQSTDAYWAWDGNLLYAPGTISPEISILDPGRAFTGTPTIAAFGGSGSGATFSVTIVDQQIALITPTATGSGWKVTDAQLIFLAFSGGGGGTTAYGQATPVNGALTGIEIVNGGTGFTSIPAITISDPTGSGAAAVVTGISGGVITGIKMVGCGANYSSPTIGTAGGGGSGTRLIGVIKNGVINAVTITNAGGTYLEAPTVNFLDPTGVGASGTAVLNSGGQVTGVDFGQGVGNGFTGEGYTGSPTYVYFSGGGVASATVRLMPFGINGRSIESYAGRAWVTTTLNGTKTFGTAPSSAVNFSIPDGGFVFPATESVLRYQYSALRQSNGFLYLIGDSSVNYVSGVQTSGAPAQTTFSNLNVDPQIGSPWPESVEVFSRAVIMANPFGVHAIYGGAVQKISTPLDGVFGTGTINPNNLPSAAVAEIFGVHVFVLLMPITDPVSGSPRNCLFLWDGRRWWSASQSTAPTKIRTNEWGSTITAYGTDGTHLFPLFQTASTSTTKTLISKMWTRPGIHVEKKMTQLYALWEGQSATTLNFKIDNENASVAVTQGPFTSAGSGAIGWGRSAAPDNIGICPGFTMTSTSADFQLIDVLLLGQERRLKV